MSASPESRWPLLVGGVLFALGVAIVMGTSVASVLSLDPLVDALGHDYFVAAFVGVVALALALVILIVRSVEGFDQTAPPDAESVPTGTPLGSDIDAALDGLGLRGHLHGSDRATVRDRLRTAAIQTQMRTTGVSRETATAAVSAGEWTDDERAAAFLARSERAPLARRVRDALPGNRRYQRQVRATIDAILAFDREVVA